MKYDELLKILRECNDCICEEHCPYHEERNNPLRCMTKIVGDAADAIEELADRNVGKWISVDERLPETDKTVLVWSHRNSKEYFNICDHGKWVIMETGDITHWMPLPEPPKEETDG